MPDQLKPSIVFDTPLPYCYTAAEVLALWPLVDEMGLYRLVMRGRLRAYLVDKDRPIVRPDGTTVYYGADEGAPHIIDVCGKRSLCWDYVRFNYLTVRLFQRQWYGEVIGTKDELRKRELAEENHPALIYSDDIELVNEDEFSYPNHTFFVQAHNDIYSPAPDLFTVFEPVIDKFSISDENKPSYSVPRLELDEWLFQCTSHKLKAWVDTNTHIEVHGNMAITNRLKTEVPGNLIAGKDANYIVTAMKSNGFDKCVIAYTLTNFIPKPLNQNQIGELLHPQGVNCTDRTHRRYAASLLDAAAKMNIRLVD